MEPTSDIPQLPAPWGPSGDQQPSAGASMGCSRPAMYGCGCLALGLVLLLIVAAVLSPRLFDWFIDTSQEAIVAALPDTVTPEERERLIQSFDEFRAGFANKSLRTEGLTRLQMELGAAYSRASQHGMLAPVDVERLQSAFDAVLAPTPLQEAPEAPSPPGRDPRSQPIAELDVGRSQVGVAPAALLAHQARSRS